MKKNIKDNLRIISKTHISIDGTNEQVCKYVLFYNDGSQVSIGATDFPEIVEKFISKPSVLYFSDTPLDEGHYIDTIDIHKDMKFEEYCRDKNLRVIEFANISSELIEFYRTSKQNHIFLLVNNTEVEKLLDGARLHNIPEEIDSWELLYQLG